MVDFKFLLKCSKVFSSHCVVDSKGLKVSSLPACRTRIGWISNDFCIVFNQSDCEESHNQAPNRNSGNKKILNSVTGGDNIVLAVR